MFPFLFRSAALILAIVLCFSVLSSPAIATQSATPAGTDACLGMGYLEWTRDDAAHTAFEDADGCVDFVEGGGTLLALRTVRVTMLPFLGGTNLCTAEVELAGFDPGTYEALNTSLGYAWRPFEVTVDPGGTTGYRVPYPFVPGADSLEAEVDGVSSGAITVECEG